MTLESTLSSMLQGSGIQQTLFETLAAPPTDGSLSVGPEQALAAFTVPIDGAQLSDLAGRTNQFSTENVGAAFSRLAERATPLVASLPGVGDVLGPLNGALATLEQLSTQDVAATLRDLASRVGAEFDGSTEGGLSGRLLRIATLLSEAGAGTSLLDLLGQLLRPTGLDLPRLPVTETFRVVDGTARAFGGLMMLETVLAEAERLSGILSRQLDAAHITAQIDGLEAALSLGPVTLADFVTSVAPNDPATVAAATNAVLAFATSLDALRDDVAAGFGLGEATLVYMKPEVILAETELALSLMR
ncbi:MAG TPA: hypothetical protein VFQ35_18635, partial [Polyangiaceae bacterium]|nr:hypothetical protein [Polyangiaceae bacterium]